MSLSHTTLGKIAKFVYYPDKVLIWVEGKEDYTFYEKILRGKPYKIEIAGGKEECKKIALALREQNLPYMVIQDGDYSILENKRSPHKRWIFLRRYSIENYFFEKDLIEQIYHTYAQDESLDPIIANKFDSVTTEIERNLRLLVLLDITNYKIQTGRCVLPSRIEQVLLSFSDFIFNEEHIQNCIAEAMNGLSETDIDDANKLLQSFILKNRFSDIINGHLIFSVIRFMIFSSVYEIKHKRPNIDNDALLSLLSSGVWEMKGSRDHDWLRTKINRVFRETLLARKAYRNKAEGIH